MVMDLSVKLSHENSPPHRFWHARKLAQNAVAKMDPQVDVVQHHGNNAESAQAESAQKVDARDALLCFLCCNRL